MTHKQSRGGGLGVLMGFIAGVGVGLMIGKAREAGESLAESGSESVEADAGGTGEQAGKEPFYESGKYT